MALREFRYRYFILLLPVCLLLNGCNVFSTLHSEGQDSDSHVLVADGQAAFKRGEFAKAKEYFRMAKERNPRDSEAIVGYAESFLKVQKFSLGEFAKTFMETMNKNTTSVTDYYELVVPAQWGVTTKAEVADICTSLLWDLDRITQGQTDGPYQAADVDINFTVALLYALRGAVEAELLPTLFQLRNLQKSSPQVQAAFDPLILAFLPDQFLWFADASGNPLTPNSFNQIRSDIHLASVRLQVAVEHAASKDSFKDIMEKIKNWDKIANP